jgi:hypothetical protein
MRQKPKFTYCGLTIVLSQPSRFDLKEGKLLSGAAGAFLNQECLAPVCNVWQCDIRTSDTLNEGLLAGTKTILLLGHRAMLEWSSGYSDYSLGEQRGCPLDNKFNLPMIASWSPQDCMDIKDYESQFNEEVQDYEEENQKEDEEDSKHKGGTARGNYRFWLITDTKKICRRLYGSLLGRDRLEESKEAGDRIRTYPPSQEVISILTQTKLDNLYVDIETDSLFQINCIGFCFEESPVFVVPICRYNYTPAYDNLGQILQSFAIAFRDNTVICHNALFDLLILAWKYHIPIGPQNYDTMLAWHRCYPEAEKSLGHVMSALTWEPYHKDEGSFAPQNPNAERKLWEYNAKDVIGTRLIRQAIDKYAKTQPGLVDSIAQSNECIRPYLINTLTGIKYSKEKLEAMVNENDRLCMQYTRIIKILLGEKLYDKIYGKSKAMSLAASPKQCCKYFHEIMGYAVVGKTGEGAPSLKADLMYRLKMKQPENVVIDLILAYRERAKEAGSLKFNPWIE